MRGSIFRVASAVCSDKNTTIPLPWGHASLLFLVYLVDWNPDSRIMKLAYVPIDFIAIVIVIAELVLLLLLGSSILNTREVCYMFLSVWRAERLKLRHSPMWLAFFLLPLIPAFFGTVNYLGNLELLDDLWYSLWTQHTLFSCYFFLPIII